MMTWLPFAILSAVFASLVTIFSKIGLKGVDSNLATAIRTIVIVIMAWGIVFISKAEKGLGNLDRRAVVFLVISGLATGASWLFYFKALQKGPTAEVAIIDKLSVVLTVVLSVLVLHESINIKTIIACFLVAGGCVLLVLK